MNLSTDFTIPVFDFDQINSLPEEQKKEEEAKIAQGLKDFGFIAVKALDSVEITEKMYSVMKDFFYSDQSVKDACILNGELAGYNPRFTDKLTSDIADFKESYLYTETTTVFPKTEEFESVAREFFSKMREYHEKVLKVVFPQLGIPLSDIEEVCKNNSDVVRCTWYPKREPTVDRKHLWCGEHCDLSPFTLLPVATAPGLMMKTQDTGEWKNVTVPAGHIIVNTGKMLETKTAGLIKATLHKVESESDTEFERFSAIFFPMWNREMSAVPYESCLLESAKIQSLSPDELRKKFPKSGTLGDVLTAVLIVLGKIENPPQELVEKLYNGHFFPPEVLENVFNRFPYLKATQ